MRYDRAIEDAVKTLPRDTLIAFSGGGDSMALLAACAARGLRHAALIDHRIQSASAQFAEEARTRAAALDVACEVIVLDWPQGPPSDHARARRARYAALAHAAHAMNLRHVATAHTREDQAETVLIRFCAHSGLRGLAGMRARAPFPAWPEGLGLHLLRPFLSVSRAHLRDWLRDQRLSWRDDPANEDLRFARVRARRVLAAHPDLAARLARVAEQAGRRSASIDARAYGLSERILHWALDGSVVMDRGGLLKAPDLVRRRLLEILIQVVSGLEEGPGAGLQALAARVAAEEAGSATLSGAQLRWRRGEVLVRVDPGLAGGRRDGGLKAPVPTAGLSPGQSAIVQGRVWAEAGPHWDAALSLQIEPGGGVFVVGPQGATPMAEAQNRGILASWRALAPERLKDLLGACAFTPA